MTDKPTRRYQLCVDKLETLEDVKKILHHSNDMITSFCSGNTQFCTGGQWLVVFCFEMV